MPSPIVHRSQPHTAGRESAEMAAAGEAAAGEAAAGEVAAAAEVVEPILRCPKCTAVPVRNEGRNITICGPVMIGGTGAKMGKDSHDVWRYVNS